MSAVLEQLEKVDQDFFLKLNGDFAPWLDRPMWYISTTWIWIPIFLILLFSLFKKYPGKHFVFVILCLVAIVWLCDRSSVLLFKEMFQRLRPSREPGLHGIVHLVKEENGNDYLGGLYGFFSSHTANYAGIVTFFILVMKPIRTVFVIALIAWVLLISYSRIYLGVHYPGDVLAGWIFGITIGWAMSKWLINGTKNRKYA